MILHETLCRTLDMILQLHCCPTLVAAIPTLEEEDSKRPNREHQKLSGEKARIINRVKGTRRAWASGTSGETCAMPRTRLRQMHTPEGVAIPPNTLAELERDPARLRF